MESGSSASILLVLPLQTDNENHSRWNSPCTWSVYSSKDQRTPVPKDAERHWDVNLILCTNQRTEYEYILRISLTSPLPPSFPCRNTIILHPKSKPHPCRNQQLHWQLNYHLWLFSKNVHEEETCALPAVDTGRSPEPQTAWGMGT